MSTDLTDVYRALDPLSPLEPGSELYVERPDNPMDHRVAVELELSDRPRHYLLVGHRGTGKTTELRRLAHALAGKRDVLMVDVGETPHLADTAPEGILAEALQSRVGARSEEKLYTVSRWLKDRAAASTARGIPILLLFDGLERLQRDADALQALNGPPPVYTWPMSVICTLPLSLYLREDLGGYARNFDRTIFLPGISVFNRGGECDPRAVEALSWILRQRAGKDAFDPEAAATLAFNSAGIHRELLQLAQRACVVAAMAGAVCVSTAHAEAAIAEQRNEYSIVLRTGDYPLLREVMETKELPGGGDVGRLIRNQLIVAYANGTTWFDVHPILRPLLQRKVPSG